MAVHRSRQLLPINQPSVVMYTVEPADNTVRWTHSKVCWSNSFNGMVGCNIVCYHRQWSASYSFCRYCIQCSRVYSPGENSHSFATCSYWQNSICNFVPSCAYDCIREMTTSTVLIKKYFTKRLCTTEAIGYGINFMCENFGTWSYVRGVVQRILCS